MFIHGKRFEVPLVLAASGLAFAASSAASAGDLIRAIGLGLAALGLMWKAMRP
jgi:hypothetical protein